MNAEKIFINGDIVNLDPLQPSLSISTTRAMTFGPRFPCKIAAAWRAQDTGSGKAGKSADHNSVDRAIFALSPYDIDDNEVEKALFRGEIVHDIEQRLA